MIIEEGEYHKNIQNLLYGEKFLENIAKNLDFEYNEAIDKGHKNTLVYD